MSKWTTKDWTQGQLNALVKNLGGEDIARGILDGTVEFVVTAKEREFLTAACEVTLPATTESFNPTAYFQTKNGLYVSDFFQERILKYAHEVDETPEVTLHAFDLVNPANDAEIRGELPEDHIFEDPSEFCAYLAQMIDQQPNGKEGDFHANGYWNIFYVEAGSEVHAVHVAWSARDREWRVHARPLRDRRWREGNRVFSATA